MRGLRGYRGFTGGERDEQILLVTLTISVIHLRGRCGHKQDNWIYMVIMPPTY